MILENQQASPVFCSPFGKERKSVLTDISSRWTNKKGETNRQVDKQKMGKKKRKTDTKVDK